MLASSELFFSKPKKFSYNIVQIANSPNLRGLPLKRPMLSLFFLILLPLSATADGLDFSRWLEKTRQEALQRGISAQIVEQSLTQLEPLEQVVKLDRRQSSGRASFSGYLKRTLPPEKIKRAGDVYHSNQDILKQVEQTYGVPSHYLVALWGIESDFGRNQGKTPVIQSLATLAYEGRRGPFFREELFHALTILDQGHVSLQNMKGSWAGAMGQVQFMPSTFLHYAIDFDRNGQIDIWGDRGDALASAANYLKKIGWQEKYGWGEKVALPRKFNVKLAGLDTRKSIKEWKQLGVRDIDGPDHIKASLLLPDGSGKQAFLVYDNFRILLKWNRSTNFALSVGHLAHRLYAERGKTIM